MQPEDRYDSLFQFYGEQNGVNWRLLKAQVKQESNFNPNALSKVGAEGLAQFMPQTFREWALKLKIQHPDPCDPEHSIQCQAAYMKWLFDRLDGNMDRVLGAYNYGIGHELKRDPWPQETIDYVRKIEATLRGYFH